VSVTRHDAERKVKILDYIAATLRARGFPPSVREIARAVGLASTSAVHHHLQILERDGYLERGAAQSRAIRLTPTAALRLGLTSELVPQSNARDSYVLPIIGEIAAGGPIEAYQDASSHPPAGLDPAIPGPSAGACPGGFVRRSQSPLGRSSPPASQHTVSTHCLSSSATRYSGVASRPRPERTGDNLSPMFTTCR
jgi:hypothetical protein